MNGNTTTYDPTLDAVYREIGEVTDALFGAYEALAEARMDAHMSLGPDFAYQRFPEHDRIAKIVRELNALEAIVAERLPAPRPVVVADDDAPF